jgi:hypothetical protein
MFVSGLDYPLLHLQNYGKNQEVNLSVLLKIAEFMNYNTGDMMGFIPDDTVIEQEKTEKRSSVMVC